MAFFTSLTQHNRTYHARLKVEGSWHEEGTRYTLFDERDKEELFSFTSRNHQMKIDEQRAELGSPTDFGNKSADLFFRSEKRDGHQLHEDTNAKSTGSNKKR